MNFKTVATIFIALTLVLGASTAYLATAAGGGSSTFTLTTVSTSILTTTVAGAPSPATSVGIAYKSGIGFYLVNGSGMTLYYRTTDIQSNGTSTCDGECIQVWPVFAVKNLVLPSGLNASSFNTVTRMDGKQQVTYDGWPLYTFSGDHRPGDVNGQGIEGIWFALGLPTPRTPAATSTTSTASTSGVSTTPSTTDTSTSSSTTRSTTSTATTTASTSSQTTPVYTYPY